MWVADHGRMTNTRTVLATLLALLLLPAVARADELVAAQPSTPATEDLALKRHAIGFSGGLFSAVGLAGLTYSYAPLDRLTIESGLGYGFSGLQLSVMPKLVLGTARDRFVAGAGLALALPRTGGSPTSAGEPFIDSDTALWLNVDAVGYEHRFANGLSLGLAAGVTVGLVGGRICVIDCFDRRDWDKEVAGLWGPQGRISVGYWF
jgi:hypothetical protein